MTDIATMRPRRSGNITVSKAFFALLMMSNIFVAFDQVECAIPIAPASAPFHEKAGGACNWTVEAPAISHTPLRALAVSEIVCHNHIMLLFDKTIGFPFASYAIHTKTQMSKLQGGRKDFVLDPLIPIYDQHAVNDTIFKYPYSRGHLTPSHIMSYDKSTGGAWEETYYISNILPQTALLNEGAWERFETNIINALGAQPDNTIWEIYTGGFWNGKYFVSQMINSSNPVDADADAAIDADTHISSKQHNVVVKDYLFWKAFCDRQQCSSGIITAFHHDGTTRWNIHSVNYLIPGIFTKCCPDNKNLDTWNRLLDGITNIPVINYTDRKEK
ncbi:MAG: DNA/RNA non-specific endonuclease [Synechococcus sp.]|nr:DNA/RNA non-specific endonuclease [Synechococcus sp.]